MILRKAYRYFYWNILTPVRNGWMEKKFHIRAITSLKRGVTTQKRTPRLVVTLTSIPGRLDKLHLCIESLLNQSTPPDHLVLWLADDLRQINLNTVLMKQKRRGLEVRYFKDIKSYKKLIPALHAFPNDVLITADDDFIYPSDWLEKLYRCYVADERKIYCHRAHRMLRDADGNLKPYASWEWNTDKCDDASQEIFPTTGAGTLFPPGSLHPDVTKEEIFMKFCPTADDIWAKAMSLLASTVCVKVEAGSTLHQISGTQVERLYDVNKSENDQQLGQVFDQYGLK